MLHDSHAVLSVSDSIVSLFWLKDMEGLFVYYSKLSTSVDPKVLESRQFCKPYTGWRKKTGPMAHPI